MSRSRKVQAESTAIRLADDLIDGGAARRVHGLGLSARRKKKAPRIDHETPPPSTCGKNAQPGRVFRSLARPWPQSSVSWFLLC